ncbi:hypothetical protein [Marinilabilia salmonicolor]|jgi:chromosome segregation ATPase|uniref:Uncharacterized protein n=1 Tax=Marinilabilia salmonicolor TaxID=989 RepID=A0A2T0XDH5_9BACT|nr:hypothetical protein [Marinilabilia salmonicolor]PRY96985.1 hypothetical protein BY457_11358 [Marinilabilia salmonicolor]RCW36687.1 hypothetical protein DFO77_108129 [Marinilabilia salmonicolor]
MKNLKLLTGTAVLAGLLLTTGCVKNEEADGVKALRQAQAAKLNAEATATTLAAEAEAAYRNAEAAVKQAEVAIKEAKARAKEIQNAYSEANNAILIANAQIAADLNQAQTQASIDKALITAEKELAEAQKELEIALSQYESEIAADVAKNKNLSAYLTAYKKAISEVNSLRQEIVGLQRNLATAQLYFLNNDLTDSGNLAAAKTIQQEYLNIRLGYLQGWVERYEAVMGDLATIADELVDVKEDIYNLKSQIDDKEVEQELAEQAREVALEEYQTAYDAWEEVVNKDLLIATFSDEENVNQEIIPYSYLTNVVDPGTIEETGAGDSDFDTEGIYFRSYKFYNDWIESFETDITKNEELISEKEDVVALLEELHEQYASQLAALEQDVITEYEKIEPLLHEVNVVEIANQAEQTTASQDALDDALDALEAVTDNPGDPMNSTSGTFYDAYTAYDEFIQDVNDSDIDLSFLYMANYSESPLGSDEEVVNIPYFIGTFNAEIESWEAEIDGWDDDMNEYEANLEIVEGYVAYLEGLQSGNLAALETAYQDAKAAFYAARVTYDEVSSELATLKAELDRAEDYESVLEGNGEDISDDLYENVTGLKEQIVQTEADIAEIDNDFANWEALIASLEAKIAQKQTELDIYQAEADHYKELIDAELGTEE